MPGPRVRAQNPTTDATAPAVARIDCHIHSQYSPDGAGSLKELVKAGREKGLTGICVTDHNTLRMAKDVKEADLGGFTVLTGIEVSTHQGHLLALGIREEVPRDLDFTDAVQWIIAAGGQPVPSHPFRRIHGVGAGVLLGSVPSVKAIEVFNARDGPSSSNRRAQTLAKKHRLGGTGGSDAHMIFEVGNGYTAFPEPVEDVEDFLRQIKKARTWGEGTPTERGPIYRQNLKNLGLWIRRGFRSM